MAKFLTTNGINYLVEEIIKSAKEKVVLVSPYLRLNSRIKELLSDGYRPDVDIRMIYGKKELDARAPMAYRRAAYTHKLLSESSREMLSQREHVRDHEPESASL